MKLLADEETKRRSGVYIIKSTITDDTYIGCTKCFRMRYGTHLRAFKNKNYYGKLGEYLKKYPAESLTMEPILLVRKSFIFQAEQIAIKQYKPSLNGR